MAEQRSHNSNGSTNDQPKDLPPPRSHDRTKYEKGRYEAVGSGSGQQQRVTGVAGEKA